MERLVLGVNRSWPAEMSGFHPTAEVPKRNGLPRQTRRWRNRRGRRIRSQEWALGLSLLHLSGAVKRMPTDGQPADSRAKATAARRRTIRSSAVTMPVDDRLTPPARNMRAVHVLQVLNRWNVPCAW